MWLPLTSLTAAGVGIWSADCRTSPTQGPAALTRARARILLICPLRSSRRVRVHRSAVARPAYAAGAGRDDGALVGGVARVQDDEARILDPAIRIFEPERIFRLERFARRVVARAAGSGSGGNRRRPPR